MMKLTYEKDYKVSDKILYISSRSCTREAFDVINIGSTRTKVTKPFDI